MKNETASAFYEVAAVISLVVLLTHKPNEYAIHWGVAGIVFALLSLARSRS